MGASLAQNWVGKFCLKHCNSLYRPNCALCPNSWTDPKLIAVSQVLWDHGTTRGAFMQIISTNPLIQVPPKILCLSWKCTLNAQPKLYIRVQLAVSRALKPGIFFD